VKDFLYAHRALVATLLLVAPGGLVLTGCASKAGTSPRLQLRSSQTRQVYAQQFDTAYFSRGDTGEYEIVLVDDGGADAGTAGSAKAGQPLRPSQAAPLRQVVHIRVHWRPLRGTKPDHPSATNAVIDWYVTAPTGDAAQANDRLHYQGAAFVEIGAKDRVAKVRVSKGQVALVEAVGSLHDPVGRSVLSGTFTATRDKTMVAANTAPLRLDAAARAERPARAVQSPRESVPGGGGQ
jgi:hypothetical protein